MSDQERYDMYETLRHCARCGGTHYDIQFYRLLNHETYDAWAMCPTLEQPILLRVVKEESK
jgi:hypothetical protein